MSDNSNNTDVTNPSKASGQFHSVKGTVVESIGNATGASSWTESGKQEHLQGEGEINAAKAKGYVEGASDRVEGKFDAVKGAVTGDKAKQTSGNLKQDAGKANQEANS